MPFLCLIVGFITLPVLLAILLLTFLFPDNDFD